MNVAGIWRRPSAADDWSQCCQLFTSQRTNVVPGERFTLYLDGELFDELLPGRDPVRFLEDGYGSYSFVLVDRANRRFVVGTDKLGFTPLYYHLSDDGATLVFSSDLNWVRVRVPGVSVDVEALEELLNLGDVLGDHTILKQVKRLGFGEKIVLTASKASLVRFWRPEVPEFCDEERYIEENIALMGEAMERSNRVGKGRVVLLSGGEDSRRIAAAAYSSGLDFSFATQKGIHSGNIDNDVLLASEIARRFDKKIHVADMATEEQYLRDCDFSDYWMGFEAVHAGWLCPMLRAIPEGSLIYDGIAGDININGARLKKIPGSIEKYRDNAALADLALGGGQVYRVPGVTASLKERVIAQLELMPESPYKLTYYYLLNHTRRSIGLNTQLFRAFGCTVCFPFLYYPLFLQSFSLQPHGKLAKNYQQVCVARQCPEISLLPSTRGKVPSEYVVDLSREARLRSLHLAGNAAIDPSVIRRYLPEFATRLKLYKLSGRLGCWPAVSRLEWLGKPLYFTDKVVRWAEDGLRYDPGCLGEKRLYPLSALQQR